MHASLRQYDFRHPPIRSFVTVAWRAPRLCWRCNSVNITSEVTMPNEGIIEINDLQIQYHTVCAVDRLSLQVMCGEIFGLLGPNGAGKTTTLACVEGLRRPDSGTIRVR